VANNGNLPESTFPTKVSVELVFNPLVFSPRFESRWWYYIKLPKHAEKSLQGGPIRTIRVSMAPPEAVILLHSLLTYISQPQSFASKPTAIITDNT
jgi:hypothetical protein